MLDVENGTMSEFSTRQIRTVTLYNQYLNLNFENIKSEQVITITGSRKIYVNHNESRKLENCI